MWASRDKQRTLILFNGAYNPQKLPFTLERSAPHLTHGSLGPHDLAPTLHRRFCSALEHDRHTDRPTDRQTDHATPSVGR